MFRLLWGHLQTESLTLSVRRRLSNNIWQLFCDRFLKRPVLKVSRSFLNVANGVLWRVGISMKANKVNLFVSSVFFCFLYHSPNILDTLHICNISWLRLKELLWWIRAEYCTWIWTRSINVLLDTESGICCLISGSGLINSECRTNLSCPLYTGYLFPSLFYFTCDFAGCDVGP
jgi:hypothetical protein